MGTYTLFTIASAAEVGLFGQSVPRRASGSVIVDWLIIGARRDGRSSAVFAFGDIRVATRSLLGIEGVSVHADPRADGGDLRQGDRRLGAQRPGLHARGLLAPGGIPFSTVAIAAVFGFLSFGGFEGAASLGEETDNPGRNIPRAIFTAVVVAGVFYILCMVTQSLGFGLSDEGIKRFSESIVAARRPQQRLHRRGVRRLHQLRRHDQRVRRQPRAPPPPRRGSCSRSRATASAATALGRTSTRSGAPAGALAVILGVVARRVARLPDQRHRARSTRSSIPARWACC